MEVFGLHIKTKRIPISVSRSKLSLIYKRSVGHRNDAWVGWEHMVCQWRGHDRLRGGQDRLRGGSDHVGRSVWPPQPSHTRLHLLTTASPPAHLSGPTPLPPVTPVVSVTRGWYVIVV